VGEDLAGQVLGHLVEEIAKLLQRTGPRRF
jgi:hypothetical protein